MQVYKTPLKEIKFLLNYFLNDEIKKSILKNSDYDFSDFENVLEEAAKICEETLLPLNQTGDLEKCVFDKGKVTTPKGFIEAYQNFISNGWQGIKVSEKYGGQNLPYFMNMLVDEMISSTNMSFGLYPGLTSNAIDAIEKNASDYIKNIYLPKLTSGKWSGTMNLTEPQCGTDLGLSKTMAVLQKDDSYKITGTKIFITCGEHDLTENIVHLVLARTPDAPKGIKGISLFLVPKIIPNEDGSLNKKNDLECGSIEKKLGINASPTCVMHYNEAKGWLVGELNKGMKAMFVMMNGARLFVGIQGLGISETAYQSALYYSKERIQGRSLQKINNPEKLADPIIVHPEIKKNLLRIKSLNEGLRGLTILTGIQFDIANSDNNKNKQFADDWVSLMTPILKSFSSDVGLESANTALQIYGGHGYVQDHGIEQLLRDVRIAPIYEGTNGIQALDLVGRKMNIDKGRLINNFFNFLDQYLDSISNNKNLEEFISLLSKSFEELKESTNFINLTNKDDLYNSTGPAVEYLKLFALVSLGYVWTKYVEISYNNLEQDKDNFFVSKIETGKYFFNKILPETEYLKKIILSGASTYNSYDDKFFDLGFE